VLPTSGLTDQPTLLLCYSNCILICWYTTILIIEILVLLQLIWTMHS